MNLSSFYSYILAEIISSEIDEAFFSIYPTRTDGSGMSVDDLFTVRLQQESSRYIKLCNTPNLSYLNLLDNENKQGDFQSSIFKSISMNANPYTFPPAFKAFEQFTSASMFYFFVKYLKDIPRDSIDLQVFNRRIYHAAKKLENRDTNLLHAVFEETVRLYYDSPSDKILLPVILKHLCTYEELITDVVYFLLSVCDENFLRELLDACIETRLSFWTMWERNLNSSVMPICPVTQTYTSGKLDLLKVLLDYGFRQTHQRVPTLKEALDEKAAGLYNYPWLKQLLFNDGQSPRSAVIDEVFLFVTFIFGSFTNSVLIGKCFLLIWAARKDPYVTRRELLDYINRFFGRLSLLRSEEHTLFRNWFLQRYEDFQASLPRYPGLSSRPRKLKHLCRCTIRETLNDNWKMPHGVATLPIPDKMKSYILLS